MKDLTKFRSNYPIQKSEKCIILYAVSRTTKLKQSIDPYNSNEFFGIHAWEKLYRVDPQSETPKNFFSRITGILNNLIKKIIANLENKNIPELNNSSINLFKLLVDLNIQPMKKTLVKFLISINNKDFNISQSILATLFSQYLILNKEIIEFLKIFTEYQNDKFHTTGENQLWRFYPTTNIRLQLGVVILVFGTRLLIVSNNVTRIEANEILKNARKRGLRGKFFQLPYSQAKIVVKLCNHNDKLNRYVYDSITN